MIPSSKLRNNVAIVSSATGGDDAYALQISQTQLRIYMGQEFGVSLDTTLSFSIPNV